MEQVQSKYRYKIKCMETRLTDESGDTSSRISKQNRSYRIQKDSAAPGLLAFFDFCENRLELVDLWFSVQQRLVRLLPDLQVVKS